MYYAGAAFGPSAGFVVGWLMYLSRLAAFGALATTMLDYGAGLWPALATTTGRGTTLTAFIAILALINIRGVVQSAWIINMLTVVKLLPLGLLAAAALSPSNWNPGRDLPFGMLGGVLGAGVLYLLLIVTCLGTVPDLARSTRPLAEAAAALVGHAGATVILLTAAISCASNLSGWMMTSPRVLYALAVQGDTPRELAAVHPVRRTPWVAILASAVVVWVMTLSGTFVYLATFSALTRLLTHTSTAAALIALRKNAGPAPIPIPFGPVLAIVAVVGTVVALGSTTGAAVRDVSIAIVLGWVVRVATRQRSRAVAAQVG
jgi:amino acid transporter